jgi:hypothetical protein
MLNPAAPHENQQHKGNDLQRVYERLLTHTESATMTAVALNIYRPSLCRRKKDLEIAGRLAVVKKSYCKITGRLVQFLSTNPAMMPINSQLKFQF